MSEQFFFLFYCVLCDSEGVLIGRKLYFVHSILWICILLNLFVDLLQCQFNGDAEDFVIQ